MKTLILVSDRLRHRFDITHGCVIADRGTIPAETVVELEARKLPQLLCIVEPAKCRAAFDPL
jgi:hypothetical protein